MGKQEEIRKSLKSYQKVKIRCRTQIYVLPIIISMVTLIYVIGSRTNQTTDQQILQKNSFQSNIWREVNSNQFNKSLVTRRYFSNYCQNNQCQNQDIQALQSIVQLLGSEYQVNLRNIVYQTLDDQPYKLQNQYTKLQSIKQKQQLKTKYQALIEYFLRPIKSPYFSSPKTKKQQLLFFIKNIFIQEDPYEGINQLFYGSQSVWQIKKQDSVLTVISNETLTPNVVEIFSDLPVQTQFQIIGLLFTPSNDIFAQKLGYYILRPGLNIYECKSRACNQEYSMVMFRVKQLKISLLKVYRRIQF